MIVWKIFLLTERSKMSFWHAWYSSNCRQGFGRALKRPQITGERILLKLMTIPKDRLLYIKRSHSTGVQIKYAGYIKKQPQQIERFKNLKIKSWMNLLIIQVLRDSRIEAVQKLNQMKLHTRSGIQDIRCFSQDINVLLILFRKEEEENSEQSERHWEWIFQCRCKDDGKISSVLRKQKAFSGMKRSIWTGLQSLMSRFKHFIDSILCCGFDEFKSADRNIGGTGGGDLPGVPLAIVSSAG